MRLTNFTDYSLRVLIFLAIKGENRATVSEISEAYDISNNHLVKVVHNLTKLGLVSSSKGRGGGLVLAKSPNDINIGKVVGILENESALVECFSENGKCKLNPACKLKVALSKAKKSFYKTLEEFTLNDIIKDKAHLKQSLGLS